MIAMYEHCHLMYILHSVLFIKLLRINESHILALRVHVLLQHTLRSFNIESKYTILIFTYDMYLQFYICFSPLTTKSISTFNCIYNFLVMYIHRIQECTFKKQLDLLDIELYYYLLCIIILISLYEPLGLNKCNPM